MPTPTAVEVERHVAKIFLLLKFATIHVALCPHPCGAKLRVLVRRIRIAAECRQLKPRCQVVNQSHVRVEVHLSLVATFDKHGAWRIDAVGRPVLGPVAVGVAPSGICWVLAGSRVEQHLRVKYVVVLVRRAKHAKVARQAVVEGVLRYVYLRHKVVVVLGLYYGVVVDVAKRGAIVRLLRASAECQIMVLHKSRSRYYVVEVGVVAAVVGMNAQPLRRSKILACRQHFQLLRHRLYAHIRLVGYLEALARALLGLHLYHARCSTRAVQSRFCCILQHGKTLYVGWIDGRQGGYVARHAVYNHKRVVAANYRGGAAHTYRRQLRHAVHAVRRNAKTRRVAVKHVEGIVHNTLVL